MKRCFGWRFVAGALAPAALFSAALPLGCLHAETPDSTGPALASPASASAPEADFLEPPPRSNENPFRLPHAAEAAGGRFVAQPAPPPPATGGETPTLPATGGETPTLPKTVVEAEAPPTAPPQLPPAPPPAPAPAPSGFQNFNSSPFASALSSSNGYNATTSTTGTIVDTPLIDYPGSVQVLTPDLMQDQAVRSLNDVIRDVPGLSIQVNVGNRQENYLLRGFSVITDQFRKDGFRDVSRALRDTANIERVEVMKGPASVLYGAGDVSGLINIITKKPLTERFDEGQVQVGSFDYYRASIDSTGPVGDSDSVFYRVNASGQWTDSFRDVVFADRGFVAPVVTWVVDTDTMLTVSAEYLHHNGIEDRGIAAFNNRVGGIRIENFYGENNNIFRVDDGQVNVFLDHRIDDDWAWQVGWASNFSDEFRRTQGSQSVVGTNVNRQNLLQYAYDQTHWFRGNLTGFVEHGDFEHRLLVGTELGYGDLTQRTTTGVATPVNIFNPIRGATQPTLAIAPQTYQKNALYGVYAQDSVKVGDYWHFMGGFRHDESDRYNRAVNGAKTYGEDSVTTQRWGAVYQPIPEQVAFYGVYAESFNPVNGLSAPPAQTPFDPEFGKLYEAGVKIDLDEAASFTFAGYQIDKTNVLVADTANPGFSTQVGGARSKGVEALLFTDLTENWSLLANCAYTDARVSEDTIASNIGVRFTSVPFFSSGFWTRCNIIQEEDRTVGMAVGYQYMGGREGVTATRSSLTGPPAPVAFDLPNFERWDLAFYYTEGKFDFQFNIENLLDVEYYTGSTSNAIVIPGAPTTLVGTLRYRF